MPARAPRRPAPSAVFGCTRVPGRSGRAAPGVAAASIIAAHAREVGWVCPGDGHRHPSHPSRDLVVDHVQPISRGGAPLTARTCACCAGAGTWPGWASRREARMIVPGHSRAYRRGRAPWAMTPHATPGMDRRDARAMEAVERGSVRGSSEGDRHGALPALGAPRRAGHRPIEQGVRAAAPAPGGLWPGRLGRLATVQRQPTSVA